MYCNFGRLAVPRSCCDCSPGPQSDLQLDWQQLLRRQHCWASFAADELHLVRHLERHLESDWHLPPACSVQHLMSPEWAHNLIQLARLCLASLVLGSVSAGRFPSCCQQTQPSGARSEACPHRQHLTLLVLRGELTWHQMTTSGGLLLAVEGLMQLHHLKQCV